MRLIDADALIEDIREHSASYFADDFAHEWVDQQPTIEPERKKGKWTVKEGALVSLDECSVCRKIVIHRAPHYNFCPHCGADMREDHDG